MQVLMMFITDFTSLNITLAFFNLKNNNKGQPGMEN